MWYYQGSTHMYIEWRGVPHYGDPTSSYHFHIYIGANDNDWFPNGITFTYNDTDTGTGFYDHANHGTIGIEHYTGYQGEEYSYDIASVNNTNHITFTPYVPIYTSTVNLVDTGRRADYSVFRPSNGAWYTRRSDGAKNKILPYGQRGDIPVPGDYDGDGDADECVLRPSNYFWFCPDPAFIVQWGTTGDIPVPADYDGDNKTDLAVYRLSNNYWFIRKSTNPASSWVKQWGTEGDIPIPAYFQSSSYATMTVYRPTGGYWFSYNQNTSSAAIPVQWGTDQDIPVPHDFNFDGMSEHAVFRPSSGNWFINYGSIYFQWGTLGDKPRCRR
jgi:hypothetical protein